MAKIKAVLLKISFIMLFSMFFLSPAMLYAQYTIAIQPFGHFDSALTALLVPEIRVQFKNSQVAICKEIPLPGKAYYQPRNRYRAEILLEYLESLRNRRHTKILGLTQKDISTTKGEYPDWGIFGLGTIGGGPSVVSTYRLRKRAGKRLFEDRLVKVVIHEIGHTFGLDHCPDPACVMADYKGTIKSLDASNKQFCVKCAAELQKTIEFLSIE